MAFELPFPQISEPSILSYNWTDVADGTGIILFYGHNKI